MEPSPAPVLFGAGGPARCSVGLLTWNAGDMGEACVHSLLAQTEPFELIWIDNASTDGTVERLRAAVPQMPPPLVNAANRGFCGGHNQGLAACRTRYYLALNQDVVLAPEYLARLCDWLDAEPELALASGLLLRMDAPPADPAAVPGNVRVYSAGLVVPRVRFAFSLGMGGPVRPAFRRRRFVPGVDGSAMMLRVEACRGVADEDGVFPEHFFAYSEEVDLALRLARAGRRCGVDGTAIAWHEGRGSGGFQLAAIRACFFANHWLLTLRHDGWPAILRDLPWIAWGELRYWLPEYARRPGAFARALGRLMCYAGRARRFHREFEQAHGPTSGRVDELRRRARGLLRESAQEPHEDD